MVSEFLASPGGKLTGLTALRNRQGWLMRGGDRLVNGCSWMNGICSGFLHLTGKSETFSYRRPSSASLRSAASPRGKPRGGSDGCFHTMHPVVPEAAGRQVGDPYSGGEDPASGRLRAAPTVVMQNRWSIPSNVVHLPQAAHAAMGVGGKAAQ